MWGIQHYIYVGSNHYIYVGYTTLYLWEWRGSDVRIRVVRSLNLGGETASGFSLFS
jgi:hypothetical protein